MRIPPAAAHSARKAWGSSARCEARSSWGGRTKACEMVERYDVMDFGFAPGALPGSLELAYLGDSVYDLYVRARLVREGGHVRDMHRAAVERVCAHAQAMAMARVEGVLTERERDVARRARNAHQTPPKNADAAEYHRATALEAVVGYLFVTGQRERMEEILALALEDDHEKR